MNGTGTDWTQIGARAHAVQFYEHDEALAELLAAYVGTALVKGDASIVFATRKHREDLRISLAERGLDLRVAQSQNRYIGLDAAEALARICSPDGWPDAVRFRRVVGETIVRATSAVRNERPRVAAFGEIVALLCANGRFGAAIRLEELWNELGQDYNFSLCCAYPMTLFREDQPAAARFMKVCAQHSHVFPAERRNISPRARVAAG